MNIFQYDVLLQIKKNNNLNQRKISENLNISLGLVNKTIKELIEDNYLTNNFQLTEQAIKLIKFSKTQNAIILAAGYGMRMVPINTEIPKGLLEVKNEVLIERIIKQLHEVRIYNIKIVVGFMKEQYEYLIDKYNVELVVNPNYKDKNNLYSLSLVKEYINNTYIIPCDIYCETNPFNEIELYSWYMVENQTDENSSIRVNRKVELVKTENNNAGNKMIGIAYINSEDKDSIIKNISNLITNTKYDNAFWEEALMNDEKMLLKAKVVPENEFLEINTYEDLRKVDSNSSSLNNDAIEIIKQVFNANNNEIQNIRVLKKGMTNRSFLFECKNEQFIMRIPGEGTDQLINRKEEFDVYNVIKETGICDDIYYMNYKNGYKITKYLNNARVCDSSNEEDLKLCMKILKDFHNLNLKVEHEFNIYNKIQFYEDLWNGKKSMYKDYEETKRNVISLRAFIESNIDRKCLTHIDAVPDNFLFSNNEIKLIDWEYSGMQDPHVDIAMFCIYALYEREQVDRLIDIYFCNKCPNNIRLKIYSYIATCGLLWSNWCEFKSHLGIDFGEYSLRQYRYAKDYYRIVKEELEKGM